MLKRTKALLFLCKMKQNISLDHTPLKISTHFCSVVCQRPSLSVNGNVCIVCLVRAWTSYKERKNSKMRDYHNQHYVVPENTHNPQNGPSLKHCFLLKSLIKAHHMLVLYLHNFFYVVNKRLLSKICIYYFPRSLETNSWIQVWLERNKMKV